MPRNVQLNLPPTEVQRVGTEISPGTNSVGTVDVVGALVKAIGGARLDQKDVARLMDLDKTTVSKALSPHEAAFNSFMKKLPRLGPDVLRGWVEAMARDLGMSVKGPDAERHALCDVVESMGRYLRVVGR